MTSNPQHIKIADYNYSLPDERIAKFPLARRDESKLLVNRDGELITQRFSDLPDLLPADSLLVFNNTKVIQARLDFRKESGARIEIFCLEPYLPADYIQSFAQTQHCEWKCLIGNAKKWKGETLRLQITDDAVLSASWIAGDGANATVRFEWDNAAFNFADILEIAGELPIPPYLNRRTEESDKTTYQTLYSKVQGSVAAPTAGLHFTPEVFIRLKEKGIQSEELTLHVGAGTFKPVKSEQIADHAMHAELFSVQRETIANLLAHLGHIVAVGTTSVRTLESLYYIGLKLQREPAARDLSVSQWEAYKDITCPFLRKEIAGQAGKYISAAQALQHILDYLDRNKLDCLQTSTQILIAPGYRFHIVDSIITNFHQPQSTLLLLVSAYLGGDSWRTMYDYALANDFRFLSYGDSSLLINRKKT
ncbi:MAG: S-adenosylmethionine:tRNA ribosyltransferase-isomerase [Prevotellaceae bacterium]|jgi:S-adenosylmethionine:tRNA ribosyltransferase-isomerase|nr:S-adenosylmethionine:tRNA ribosyltransferase-isomerase [Prevotellaceae bacterium]